MKFYEQPTDNTSSFVFWVGANPMDALNVFAMGYRLSAEKLTRSLLRKRRFSDYEAYPVIFLYRHAFELVLKHCLYKAAEYAGYTSTPGIDGSLQNHHRLAPLAKTTTAALTLLFPDDLLVRKIVPRILTTANDLGCIDPNSYVYRYPIDIQGQPSAKNNQGVNLRSFARHMSSLLEDIDTINFGLNAMTDVAEEAFVACLESGLRDLP